MYKYAVYGNKEKTPLQVAGENGLNLDECILCPDGKIEAEDCKKINPKLKLIGLNNSKIIIEILAKELQKRIGNCPYMDNDLKELGASGYGHWIEWAKKFMD